MLAGGTRSERHSHPGPRRITYLREPLNWKRGKHPDSDCARNIEVMAKSPGNHHVGYRIFGETCFTQQHIESSPDRRLGKLHSPHIILGKGNLRRQ
jgi:hypothetical protein